jgi:hypothetical protein
LSVRIGPLELSLRDDNEGGVSVILKKFSFSTRMTEIEETQDLINDDEHPRDGNVGVTVGDEVSREELIERLAQFQKENERLKSEAASARENDSNRDKSESQRRSRSRTPRTPTPERRLRKKMKRSKADKPHVKIPVFGEHPPAERRQAWYKWLDIFESAASLTPNLLQWEKAAFLKVSAGDRLTETIRAFGLEEPRSSRPYDDLVDNISRHFESLTDATVEQKRIQECRQESGEAASDFFERLVRVMGHKANDEDSVKVHFVSNLRDASFQALAAVNGWNLYETVAAASRSEGFKVAVPPRQMEIANVNTGRGAFSGARRGTGRRPWEQGRGRGGGQRWGRPNPVAPQCNKCMRRHENGVCKAADNACNNCGEKGHFWRACKKPKSNVNEVMRAIEPSYD